MAAINQSANTENEYLQKYRDNNDHNLERCIKESGYCTVRWNYDIRYTGLKAYQAELEKRGYTCEFRDNSSYQYQDNIYLQVTGKSNESTKSSSSDKSGEPRFLDTYRKQHDHRIQQGIETKGMYTVSNHSDDHNFDSLYAYGDELKKRGYKYTMHEFRQEFIYIEVTKD